MRSTRRSTNAGLTLDQIDGVFSFPGKSHGYLAFSPVGTDDLIEVLGIKSKWQMGAMEQPAQLSAIGMAAMAVKEGICRHVICFRTVYEAGGMANPAEYMPLQHTEVSGSSQWTSPFWATSAACWTAQYAQRHVYKYGMTREQLAQIAINGSKNAMLNPNARAITKEELTLDKYMDARLISTPLCLYDCDRFSDASTVIIVSAGDALDEVSAEPVRIAAMSGSVEPLLVGSGRMVRRLRCRARPVEEHRLQRQGRRYRPVLRRLRFPAADLARRPRLLRKGRGAQVHRRRHADRPRRRTAAQHRRRPTGRRTAARLRLRA